MQKYDKSSKWLIQHHGVSILWIAGLRDVARWRPLQAELVQPRRYPDGLIEVWLKGRPDPLLFILELATYPEPRISEQAVRDAALVYLDRGIMPEVLVLVLCPKGTRPAAASADLRSPAGWTRFQVSWRMIELWNVPASSLLDAGDVGLIPWVPLSQYDGPPEPLFRLCRDRIGRAAPESERANLFAVSQVLAGLRYDDESLIHLLGGRKAMIESPVLQRLKKEWTEEGGRKAQVQSIIDLLEMRFGKRVHAVEPELALVADDARLRELLKLAVTCNTLKDFRAFLRERGGPS